MKRLALEVRHLEMLVAIADTGSVTLAADVLGVTQSALSHRLKEAERRLDAGLFTRHNKRLRMTPAGQRLHRAATRMLASMERAEADVEAMTRGAHCVMRIGIGLHTRYQWLPPFLARFRETAPEVEVEVAAVANRRPLDLLVDGAIDVAVIAGDPERPGLRKLPMFKDELVAIMAPDHRLAGKPFIEAEDLVDEVFITYSSEYQPGHEYDRLMRPAGLYPKREMLVEQPEAIIELVRAGFGVSILTRWWVEPHLSDGTLVCAAVTRDGLTIDGWAVVRDADGKESPSHRLAEALTNWSAEDEAVSAQN